MADNENNKDMALIELAEKLDIKGLRIEITDKGLSFVAVDSKSGKFPILKNTFFVLIQAWDRTNYQPF